MYSNSFVAGIKNSQGAILRESDDIVYLPFNSEYSLYLRNNNSRRASVSITIDGTDVLGGGRLMLNPNQPFDLKRFVLDGNFDTGKAFKFVSLFHPDVQNPTGKCNGRIDVEFRLEKYQFPITTYYYPVVYPIWPPPVWINLPYVPPTWPQIWCSTAGSTTATFGFSPNNTTVANSISGTNQSSTFQAGPIITPEPEGKKGATVEGSQVDQRFVSTTVGELEDVSTIISLQILAPNDVPVIDTTVEGTRKKYCIGCGKKLGFSDMYCGKCGAKQ